MKTYRRAKSLKVPAARPKEDIKDSDVEREKSYSPRSCSTLDFSSPSEDEVVKENVNIDGIVENVCDKVVENGIGSVEESVEEVEVVEKQDKTIEHENGVDSGEEIEKSNNKKKQLVENNEIIPVMNGEEDESEDESGTYNAEKDSTPNGHVVKEIIKSGPPVHSYDDRKNPFMDDLFEEDEEDENEE